MSSGGLVIVLLRHHMTLLGNPFEAAPISLPPPFYSTHTSQPLVVPPPPKSVMGALDASVQESKIQVFGVFPILPTRR